MNRIYAGLYKNSEWTIQKSGRMGVTFWFAYRNESLTTSAWNDPAAKSFLTLAEAKKFVTAQQVIA